MYTTLNKPRAVYPLAEIFAADSIAGLEAENAALVKQGQALRKAMAVVLARVDQTPRILARGGTLYVPLSPGEVAVLRAAVHSK